MEKKKKIEGLDGETALVRNINFEENVPEVYHRIVQGLFHRFLWNLQDTLSISLTKYPANFMEIDQIDPEQCERKL